jgi:hypothetical protein
VVEGAAGGGLMHAGRKTKAVVPLRWRITHQPINQNIDLQVMMGFIEEWSAKLGVKIVVSKVRFG